MKYGISYNFASGTKPSEYKKAAAIFEKKPGFEKIGETFWVVSDLAVFSAALLEINRLEADKEIKILTILDIK